MKHFRIRGMESLFLIEPGVIYNLNIENYRYAYQLIQGIEAEDDACFIRMEGLDETSFFKNTLVCTDAFHLDPNEKKNLNSLYKTLNTELSKNKDKIIEINEKILDLLRDASMRLDVAVDYNVELDVVKLLGLYGFSFQTQNDSFLDEFVVYIKSMREIMKFDTVICFNILPLINLNRVNLFKKELELLGLTLLNVNFILCKNDDTIKTITIDEDLCEF